MAHRQHTTDLTQGPIGRTLFAFFLPIAGGNLFNQFYNTADALIISRFAGTGALAAVGGSASQIIAVIIGLFSSLSGGAGVVIAQAYGSGRKDRISAASGTAAALSLLAGLIFSAGGILLCPWILQAMRTPEDTLADSILYLRIYFGGMVFNTVYFMGAAILRAAGDSRRPLIVLIVCCAVNIGLDIVMVACLGMGVAGVALATVISQLISAIVILWYLTGTSEAYRLSFHTLRPEPESLRAMLHIGVPAALQASMYNVSNLIIQIALNQLGTVAVASWSMSGKVDGVFWAVSNALGTALMSFVGQNFGALRKDRIRAGVRRSLFMFFAATLALEAAILAFGQFCLSLLTGDAAVIDCTRTILWCFVPFYFLWTFIEIFSSSLRGIGDTVIPVVITGLGICAFRMLWIVLVFPRFHTIVGLSMCYAASWLVTALVMGLYYRRKSRLALSD